MQSKSFISFLLLLINITVFQPLFAQQERNLPAADSLFHHYAVADRTGYDPATVYYLVRFTQPIPPGTPVIRQFTERLAVIPIQNADYYSGISVRADIAIVKPEWKFSPASALLLHKKSREKTQFVLSAAGKAALLALQEKYSSQDLQILSVDEATNSLVVQCLPEWLQQVLIKDDAVIFADHYIPAQTEAGVIGYKRYFNSINLLDFITPGANGKNIVVGVKEQQMNPADIDLHNRILPSSLAGGNIERHATDIASLIGGAGNSFYDGRGLANGCRFFPSYFSNLFADDSTLLNQNKVSVQNHSYGTTIQSYYGAEAASYDIQTWHHKTRVHVFSAGNRGTEAPADGPYAGISGFANLTANFKMAKNIINVAAIDNKGNIEPFSSSGPAYDGRLTPQLTALGANGTSDAAALVSGTVAVLQQVYADSNNQQLPPASLIKSILYNTADDIHLAGIDYKTGYGLLNAFEALLSLRNKQFDNGSIANGQSWQKTIDVPASSVLKVTLAWTDTASSANNNKALINDLDLAVEEINTGIIYQPWVLSSTAVRDSLLKPAVRKRDSLNTAEQVTISMPAPGQYRILVNGTAVSQPSIAFHVSFLADTLNRFYFTNPVHTADINRDEDPVLPVRWKTSIADTNTTGNLFISYNNGSSWELVTASVKLNRQRFDWTIKDTASVAQFRMETPFGNFHSRPVIISKVLRPRLDFLCTDSFRLSWNKHIYASGYQVYALTDSPYLKKILTVTDSFAVFQSAQNPAQIYAVEPVLANGIPAARSIALNINQQGVFCFYRALNYTLLDGNSITLTLQLSTTANTDSVSFERVTQQGQLLQRISTRTTIAGIENYEQAAGDLPGGLNYFRARIRLKNGADVYTDIIAVLSSGNQEIFVYPNPVRPGGTIHFQLKDQLRYFQFRLHDINGKPLYRREIGFAGELKLPPLPAGLYIYVLIDENGKQSGAGRMVIY